MRFKLLYLLVLLVSYICFVALFVFVKNIHENNSKLNKDFTILNETMISVYGLENYQEDFDFALGYQTAYTKNWLGIFYSMTVGYSKPKNNIGQGLRMGFQHVNDEKMNAITPILQSEKPAQYKIKDGKLLKQ